MLPHGQRALAMPQSNHQLRPPPSRQYASFYLLVLECTQCIQVLPERQQVFQAPSPRERGNVAALTVDADEAARYSTRHGVLTSICKERDEPHATYYGHWF